MKPPRAATPAGWKGVPVFDPVKRQIIEKEFTLSGSEQNPDLTGKDLKLLLGRLGSGAPGPVEAFKEHGEDFVVADTLADLVAGMNRIGAGTPGSPRISEDALRHLVGSIDFAEVCITSVATLVNDEGPADAFRMPEIAGVAVVVNLAEGRKCARSWKILPSVGSDPAYPDVSPRDAKALREWKALGVAV